MRNNPTTGDVRRAVADAGPNPWFRPVRIINGEYRYYGTMRHTGVSMTDAMLDLHRRGFLVEDAHGYHLDLIGEDGSDLYDSLPISREGMRFLRSSWKIRIQRPERYAHA